MAALNHIPEHLRLPRKDRLGWLRSPIVRLVVFTLPGILLLAGGRTTTPYEPSDLPRSPDFLFEKLHPDNWPALILCSVLICLPGWLMYAGAEYLAEVTFARLMHVNTTPEIIWRILGFLIAFGAAFCALVRLLAT